MGREFEVRDVGERGTPEKKGKYQQGLMSADYIKGLENRRRLYEESGLNQGGNDGYSYTNPTTTNPTTTAKKKYHYVPDSSL